MVVGVPYRPASFYCLDMCWVCRKVLRTPLHRIELRQLGVPRVHRQCFKPNLFVDLESHAVLTVGLGDTVEELTSGSPYERRNGKYVQQEMSGE